MCKHGKKVRSSQGSISINSCTELSKAQFSLFLALNCNLFSVKILKFVCVTVELAQEPTDFRLTFFLPMLPFDTHENIRKLL